ncbi:MAG: NTP transferase domain-containing protein [Paracoccaceae bacterium]
MPGGRWPTGWPTGSRHRWRGWRCRPTATRRGWRTFDCEILADATDDRLRPLAGLAAGRPTMAQGGTHLATVPVDAPFIPCDLVARLADGLPDASTGITLAESGGRLHPTRGLWPVGLGRGRWRWRWWRANGGSDIGRWRWGHGRCPLPRTDPDQCL